MPTKQPLSRTLSLRRVLRNRRTVAEIQPRPGEYDVPRDPPATTIGGDGGYTPGWFHRSPGAIAGSVQPRSRRFHRWFFVHFDTPEYFVSANLIDLYVGGNVGIVVLDKRTGKFRLGTDSGLWFRNFVEITPDCREFRDRRANRFIRVSEDDGRIEFDVVAEGLALRGIARAHMQPFVQTTAFEPGLGTHQQWGNMILDSGQVEFDGRRVDLPAGCPGAYDRSFGHRRLLENWNWIVACGSAKTARGAVVPFALHAAHDRSLARPIVDGRKYVLWVGEHFLKLPRLSFDYRYVDMRTLDTTGWTIRTSREAADGAFVDLRFDARFHRRERVKVPLVFDVDHSNYFGALNGEIGVGRDRFVVTDVFAATEDSMMVI